MSESHGQPDLLICLQNPWRHVSHPPGGVLAVPCNSLLIQPVQRILAERLCDKERGLGEGCAARRAHRHGTLPSAWQVATTAARNGEARYSASRLLVAVALRRCIQSFGPHCPSGAIIRSRTGMEVNAWLRSWPGRAPAWPSLSNSMH